MKNAKETRLLRTRLASPLCAISAVERLEFQRRVIPPSRSAHVRGWRPFRRGEPSIPFESLLECRTIAALAMYPEVLQVVSQPVTMNYRYAERLVRYTPDFFVTCSSVPDELAVLGFELETYVEVKPFLVALREERKLARQFVTLRTQTNKAVVLLTDLDLPELSLGVRYGH